MREYVIRVRPAGDGYAATLRELQPCAHPESVPLIGAEAVGAGVSPHAAMVSAIANARLPEFVGPSRRPYSA